MVINLVNGALKAGDLKQDIPDPLPGSQGGFLTQFIQQYINSGVETPYKELQC